MIFGEKKNCVRIDLRGFWDIILFSPVSFMHSIVNHSHFIHNNNKKKHPSEHYKSCVICHFSKHWIRFVVFFCWFLFCFHANLSKSYLVFFVINFHLLFVFSLIPFLFCCVFQIFLWYFCEKYWAFCNFFE